MQEQIIELLTLTRSGDSINSAEEQLNSLSESPEFLPSLISIYSSSEIPEITRMSALLYMNFVVSRYWKDISAEVQNLVKSSLPEIIINWPNSKKNSMYHFAHLVVDSTINSASGIDWPELPEYIVQLLSEGNENSCKVGLVLSNSLCGSIKVINKNNQAINEWAVNFGLTLLPILAQLFSQCESYEFLSLGFHCASRILKSNADFDFFSFAESLIPIVEKSFLISNYVNQEEYLTFAYKALKFSNQYLTRYITILPITLLEQYLQVIQQLLSLEIPTKMKCDLLKLMNEIFKNPESWDFISSNLIEFLTNLILPLYALTPDNIASLNNNPEEFISDVNKSENSNFEDIRLSASQIILTLYKNEKNSEEEEIPCSQQIVDACRIIAGEMYTNYMSLETKTLESQIALFASFQMFSTVSKNMNYDVDPQLYKKFFSEISPLFDSEDELARSAAFMLLSESSNVQAPIDLTMKCIEHIVDDFPIVRYYAVIAVSGLLEKSNDIAQIQKNFADSSVISEIFNSLFELSQQFHFSDIAVAVSTFINVFNKQILPIAMSIFTSLMEFLSMSSDSVETMQTIITDSLEKLVELISKNEEAVQSLAPTFCEECLNTLQSIEYPDVFDLLLSETKEIIDLLPFIPSMWPIAEMIIDRIKNDPKISVTDPIEMITSFVIKDDEFATRDVMTNVVSFCIDQMMEKVDDFDYWSVFANLASNILMRLRGNPAQQELIEPLASMSISQIETTHQFISSLSGIATLVNSLLLTNFEAVSQILNEKFNVFIEFWINNPMLPESIMTLVVCFDNLSSDSDTLLKALISVGSCMFPDIIEMDFDEYTDYVKSFPWLDFSGILLKFSSQLETISHEKPDLYSQFLDAISDWQEDIPKISEIANRFGQEKK